MQCVLDARAALGQHREAREAAVSILRVLGDPEADALAAAPAEQALARFDRRMVERLDDRRTSLVRPSRPYAFFYGELGDKDRAIAWLERALADHDPVLLLVRVHPAFDSLRSDSRLEPLLRRAGV
jgi:tetratricopeptide (TPR) repeat protein